MNMIKERPLLAVIVSLFLGLALGLIYAWVISPVEFTNAGPGSLSDGYKSIYVRAVADNYSWDGNIEKAKQALSGDWGGAEVACAVAQQSTDPAEQQRLNAVAALVNGQGCTGMPVTDGEATAPVEEQPDEEGGSLFSSLLPLLLLVVLVGAIFYFWQRRNALIAESGSGEPDMIELPEEAPVSIEDDLIATPLARFRTTYNYGYDVFDDSFSIENTAGDFLGECGVGISESVGTDVPKNVTAFELWLFDKNDIRTITKVIMSDHAFFDEALKAKLAPKGEPVLAREGETIVLETATLIINAEIKELGYGTGTLPPQSFFDRMTLEISTWAKDNDFEPEDLQSRVDDIMNY